MPDSRERADAAVTKSGFSKTLVVDVTTRAPKDFSWLDAQSALNAAEEEKFRRCGDWLSKASGTAEVYYAAASGLGHWGEGRVALLQCTANLRADRAFPLDRAAQRCFFYPGWAGRLALTITNATYQHDLRARGVIADHWGLDASLLRVSRPCSRSCRGAGVSTAHLPRSPPGRLC